MKKLIELPLFVNKKNGQITSYFNQKKMPKKLLEAIKKQPSNGRKLLAEIKGVVDV